MKIFDKIVSVYLVFKEKFSKLIFLQNTNKIRNFDNSDFLEEEFKKKLLFVVIFLFIIILFVSTYIFIWINIGDDSEALDENVSPLKIVIPYPNNAINIDDYEIIKYKIKNGDILLNILTKNVGISNNDAFEVLSALKKVYNVSQLKAGQIIDLKYRILVSQGEGGQIEEKVVLEELKLTPDDREKEVVVSLNNDKYEARKNKVALNKSFLKYKVTINENLFSDGVAAGVPPSIMLDFIKFFSFDIDFQRDLRQGDTFEVLFESYYTDDGKKVKDGDILFASINNQNKNFEIYKFGNNYYDGNGQSVQKSLLKTPVNGARISSGFGMRKHPILGYSKFHAGKDFAAPIGTPIFAAGSGTVVKAQFWSTWGNYVRIRHTNGYETEYAHASKIVPGIKPGVKVKQGQVIAYVGTTGRSTGPHLHYGVIYNNQRINPDRVKSLPTVRLIGKDLINFKDALVKTDLYRLNIPNQNLRLKK
ncbi:MAG TPA: peptidoglycan DD-metalloendopeptidase family protein [Rickettsiales bacterium]|nr:peptidoglycan DD-metalloendopeptidase family protein [Rickettsiales bacterium]